MMRERTVTRENNIADIPKEERTLIHMFPGHYVWQFQCVPGVYEVEVAYGDLEYPWSGAYLEVNGESDRRRT